MEDYYSLFVDASLQMCLVNDYSDKNKVKQNNRAANQILKLQDELCRIDCKEIIIKLLSHSDDRVRLNASVLCYKANMFTKEAIQVLQDISKTSVDPILALNAKVILSEYFSM